MGPWALPDGPDIYQIVSELEMRKTPRVDGGNEGTEKGLLFRVLLITSSGPGTSFTLVLRNPSSCLSRKAENRLLPAAR